MRHIEILPPHSHTTAVNKGVGRRLGTTGQPRPVLASLGSAQPALAELSPQRASITGQIWGAFAVVSECRGPTGVPSGSHRGAAAIGQPPLPANFLACRVLIKPEGGVGRLQWPGSSNESAA